MPIRLNLLCNGSLRKDAHSKWEKNFDKIFFDGPKRDEFGIIINTHQLRENNNGSDEKIRSSRRLE
jgi:hypothetical protein